MTERQKEIFEKLVEFIKEKGYTPTVRELGKSVGLSSSATVQKHLKTFESKGLIKRVNNRKLEVIEDDIR